MFSASSLFLSTLLVATVYVAVSSEVEGVIIQVRNSRASPKWIARAGPNRQCNCSEPSSATDVMPCMSRPTFGRALVNGSCSYEVVCSENKNRIPRRLYSVVCHSSDANSKRSKFCQVGDRLSTCREVYYPVVTLLRRKQPKSNGMYVWRPSVELIAKSCACAADGSMAVADIDKRGTGRSNANRIIKAGAGQPHPPAQHPPTLRARATVSPSRSGLSGETGPAKMVNTGKRTVGLILETNTAWLANPTIPFLAINIPSEVTHWRITNTFLSSLIFISFCNCAHRNSTHSRTTNKILSSLIYYFLQIYLQKHETTSYLFN